MNDERIGELINKSIDRQISESEKAELDGYLQADSELNEHYRKMVKSSETVNKLPDYEVSPNVKKIIMNSVENSGIGNTSTQKQKAKPSLVSFRSPKFVVTFTFGIAVVCVCVFLLWNNFGNSSTDKNSMSGYMGKSETEMEALPFDTREIYKTDLLGVESSLKILRSKDTLYISMDKKTPDEISIGYSFDPTSVSFVTVRENISTSPIVKTQDGKVSVTLTEPAKVFTVFRIIKPSSEMDMQVRNTERQIFRYKFNTDKEKFKI
jgi:hypothetical protein